MAVPAFSTLLHRQLEGTKTPNIHSGALEVDISTTYFYGHFLPSDELAWLPTCFFFCKNRGGEEQVKRITSIMK